MLIKKFKNFKSPGLDNIPAELINAGRNGTNEGTAPRNLVAPNMLQII